MYLRPINVFANLDSDVPKRCYALFETVQSTCEGRDWCHYASPVRRIAGLNLDLRFHYIAGQSVTNRRIDNVTSMLGMDGVACGLYFGYGWSCSYCKEKFRAQCYVRFAESEPICGTREEPKDLFERDSAITDSDGEQGRVAALLFSMETHVDYRCWASSCNLLMNVEAIE